MSGRVLRDQFTDEQAKDFLNQCQLVPKRFLIYPANFWAHKNHEMLITSFGIARSMGLSDDVKLVCTGAPGTRRDFLMDLVNRLGLRNHIIFPGYVTDAQLGILMTNAIAMVFPSLYEGFGLPVIEAMANGIPVACSNVTSLPEVAGNAAITFNPKIPKQIANAMLELVNNPDKVISLINLGKKRASLFENSAQMTQEYWELFDSALRSKS